MKLALREAQKGWRSVFPNPMVGCVIVNGTTIVAKGYHQRFGGPHAEQNALLSAGKRARGADLYVTLEPCAHWGKTPPCADAIAAAGIRRVFYGMADPNPATACRCHAVLKDTGIEYIGGVLARESLALNREYIRLFKGKHMPHVIAKTAMTLDGKIALASGDSQWITGTPARKHVHRMRTGVDGIVVGVNTVLKDNPRLTSHGAGRNPVRIVIDPSLQAPTGSHVFNDESGTIVFHSRQTHKAKLEVLKQKGVVPLAMETRDTFKHIIQKLQEMHIYSILIEGGGETIGRAFDEGVVDEIAFFVAPKIAGGARSITPVEGAGVDRISAAIPLGPLSVKRLGRDLLVRARVEKQHVYRHR